MKWNQFVRADCFDVMKDMSDKSVDFIFTSLPDISQTSFGNDIKSYQDFQRDALEKFSRII